mmetsp:Transcript_31054/g.77950  ORF Transcript_31054/g.77950 Transcript_31054/m.77950 type:complete len:241 (-) Transcript_31054:940-1662(-)
MRCWPAMRESGMRCSGGRCWSMRWPTMRCGSTRGSGMRGCSMPRRWSVMCWPSMRCWSTRWCCCMRGPGIARCCSKRRSAMRGSSMRWSMRCCCCCASGREMRGSTKRGSMRPPACRRKLCSRRCWSRFMWRWCSSRLKRRCASSRRSAIMCCWSRLILRSTLCGGCGCIAPGWSEEGWRPSCISMPRAWLSCCKSRRCGSRPARRSSKRCWSSWASELLLRMGWLLVEAMSRRIVGFPR